MSQFAQAGGAEAAGGSLASVPLDSFLSSLPPEVRRVYDAGAEAGAEGGVPVVVRWVEPSELTDPTPYLLEHEVVLTAGLPFLGDGGTADAVDRYVQRLTRVKVSALVFGLHPYFEEIPEVLVAACRQHRLTLVEAPAEVPFAALGLQFARLLEAENVRVMRQMAEGNRHLMRAVLAPRPESDLLGALMRTIPGWALVVGANRKVRARAVAAKSPVGVPHLSMLDEMLSDLFAGRGPRVEMRRLEQEPTGWVVAHPLRGARDETLGALLIGSSRPLDATEQSIVGTAIGLLEVLLRQRTEGALAPSQLATSLLLRFGQPDADRRGDIAELVAQSAAAPSGAEVRVVQGFRAVDDAGARAGTGATARDRSRAHYSVRQDRAESILQWRRIFDTKLVELTDFGFTAVTRLGVEPGLVREVEALGWRLVISDAVAVADLPEAHRRLAVLRSQAMGAGRTLRESGEPVSVPALLGKQAGEILFEHAFAALRGLDEARAAGLLDVLEAWLSAHGSWDATAKATGLHRNSVRRHIGQLAELIGRDLGDAGTRAELLIALRYRPSSYVISGDAAGSR